MKCVYCFLFPQPVFHFALAQENRFFIRLVCILRFDKVLSIDQSQLKLSKETVNETKSAVWLHCLWLLLLLSLVYSDVWCLDFECRACTKRVCECDVGKWIESHTNIGIIDIWKWTAFHSAHCTWRRVHGCWTCNERNRMELFFKQTFVRTSIYCLLKSH